jgi:hypothetical protein
MSDKIQKLTDYTVRRPQRQTHTKESFIAKSQQVHGNRYSYELVDWTNGVTKVNIVCEVHGIFKQYPFHHLKGHLCKACGISKRSGVNAAPHKKLKEQIADDLVTVGLYGSMKINCKIHGSTEQSLRRHRLNKGWQGM